MRRGFCLSDVWMWPILLKKSVCGRGAIFPASQASFLERDAGGPHDARPSQSKVPVVDLQRQPDEIEDLTAIQTNFRERSTFDFFNRIGHERTFPIRRVGQGSPGDVENARTV